MLLHQTVIEQEWSTRLLLNGAELCLGTILDVVDKVNGRREFEIGLLDGDRRFHWVFAGDRREMSAAVSAVRTGATELRSPTTLRFLMPADASPGNAELARRLRRLSYLTAERVGPREVYPLADPGSTEVVGPRGENAASLLHWQRDEEVLGGLAVAGHPPTRLHQVAARMRQFFPNCSVEVRQVPQANAVTLGLRTSDATDFHRPIHVGFGLTQVLPIVIAALSREHGDLLLIENPEVHLHPAGQAMMGCFFIDGRVRRRPGHRRDP